MFAGLSPAAMVRAVNESSRSPSSGVVGPCPSDGSDFLRWYVKRTIQDWARTIEGRLGRTQGNRRFVTCESTALATGLGDSPIRFQWKVLRSKFEFDFLGSNL